MLIRAVFEGDCPHQGENYRGGRRVVHPEKTTALRRQMRQPCLIHGLSTTHTVRPELHPQLGQAWLSSHIGAGRHRVTHRLPGQKKFTR